MAGILIVTWNRTGTARRQLYGETILNEGLGKGQNPVLGTSTGVMSRVG